MAKILARVVHLYTGLDLIGSKTSINASQGEVEVTPIGIKVTSKKTSRIVLIPWANVKGCELMPEDDVKPVKK